MALHKGVIKLDGTFYKFQSTSLGTTREDIVSQMLKKNEIYVAIVDKIK